MKIRQQKKPYLLSICIPTYNGAGYIGQAIESFELVKNKQVEIVICDDASSDNTYKVVKKYQKIFPNIVIYRNRKNLGFDRNMIKVAKKAKGEYCWYLGQDDYLRKGAVSKIIKIIEEKHPAFMLCNFTRFDNVKQKFTAKRMIEGKSEEFQNPEDFFFKRTKRSYFPFMGVNLIYISILVFKHSQWLKAMKKTPEKYIGSDFFHTFVMTRLIDKNPSIYYLAKPIVVYRDKNIRLWDNKDIWGYYIKKYLPYLNSLGWNRLMIKYTQLVVSIHNRPKRGLIAKIRNKIYTKVDLT